MSISYRWTDSNQTRILLIDEDVRTCFKVAVKSPAQERYLEWLAEGNEPLPADS
jgi:hypothetical protein